jgi:hypothetical protein
MCPFVKDSLCLFGTFLNDRFSQSNPGNVSSNMDVFLAFLGKPHNFQPALDEAVIRQCFLCPLLALAQGVEAVAERRTII